MKIYPLGKKEKFPPMLKGCNCQHKTYLESSLRSGNWFWCRLNRKDRFILSMQADKECSHYKEWYVGWRTAEGSYHTKSFLDALLSFLTFNKWNFEKIKKIKLRKQYAQANIFKRQESSFDQVLKEIDN